MDTLLYINKIVEITSDKKAVVRNFEREIGKIWIELETTRQSGETVHLQIYYQGNPRVAVRAPWDGGFSWAKTKDGAPWIATTCQGEGPDIWWPVKDHVSDEPDSMGIHIRVPDPLVCATNGKLLSVEKHDDATSTYYWFVSTPINNYTVALNIAPYKLIEQQYKSTSGDVFPFKFWVLPEDYEKGQEIFPEFIEHMRFFEETLGPYPFRADKYGVAQTPHLGMEHQTIIAYGANFNNAAMTGKDWGFDALHHHELAHEWWGNLVTNADWKDMWIHEGFGTYMQALYMEHLKGMDAYHEYIAGQRMFRNNNEIAPEKSVPNSVIYRAPIYSKGATVLHTLRYLIGDDNLKTALRRMLYPTPEMEKVTDGSHTRFVSTNDFKEVSENLSGQQLDWFFNLYTHQPALPRLKADLKDNTLVLKWITPDNMPFPMPVDIKIGEELKRIEIPAEGTKIKVKNQKILIDPHKWVLFEPAGLEDAASMINQGKFEKAEALYKNVLFIDPENSIAERMLKHTSFAMANPNDESFKKFLGTYKVNENRIYNIIEEDGNYYLTSRRIKYRIYPVSDYQFVVTEFNADYYFTFDQDSNVAALVLENPRFRMQANKVE